MVVQHAEKALDKIECLDEAISQKCLSLIVNSTELMKSPDAACIMFSKYSHIKRTFPLSLAEVEMYLKSNLDNKYEQAFSIMLSAFYNLKEHKDENFTDAFHLFNELNNLRPIPLESEKILNENLFFQISGLDSWFYLGQEEKKLNAIQVPSGSERYNAVIGKSLEEKITWPPDKHLGGRVERKITYILSPAAYLIRNCQISMNRASELGTAPIWKISLSDEKGKFTSENIIKFLKPETHRKNNFFENFKNSLLPISFLCQVEGNMFSAMQRIIAEKKGFVFCNNTKLEDINRQSEVARESLNGKICFLDGFTALILIRGNILELVIKSIPNLCVPTSTIRFLREMASQLYKSESYLGGLILENDKLIGFKTNKPETEILRQKIIDGANLLDSSVKKYNSIKKIDNINGNKLDSNLPNYFTDAFNLAKENNAFILTDDGLLNIAYTAMGETTLPDQFSSISLIRQIRQ